MKLFLLSLIVLFASSCTYYIKIKELENSQEIIPPKRHQTLCTKKIENTPSIAGTNDHATIGFQKFLKRLRRVAPLSFIDQIALWSMIQINFRPDISSPTSRLQTLITIAGESKYFDFHIERSKSKNNQTYLPYLYGVESILKTFHSKYSLERLASFIDKYFKSHIAIDKDFHNFLANHKSHLLKTDSFKRIFFRADQPLSIGERLPHISYRKLIKSYRYRMRRVNKKNSPYKSSNYLFSYRPQVGGGGSLASCNSDLTIYDHSIYGVSSIGPTPNNIFGLGKANGDNFIAVSSQTLIKIKEVEIKERENKKDDKETTEIEVVEKLAGSTFLISGNAFFNSSKTSICSIADSSSKSYYSLISSAGRDPAQILHFLLNNGVAQTSSLSEIDKISNHPRLVYISNPLRVVFESSRANSEELAQVYRKGVAVYHKESLGNVWIYAKLGKSKQFGLVTDSRRFSHVSCF